MRRAIREAFDADGRKCSALSIYDALTEIASNEQSDTFTKSHDYIASFAGLDGKTSKRIMPIFEKMKIVHVRRNGSDGLQTANTYTLLPLGLKVPTQGQSQKNDMSLVLNKSSEESAEKSDDCENAKARNEPFESSSIHFSSLEEAKKHPYWKKFARYCESQPNGIPTLAGFNTWLRGQPLVKTTKEGSKAQPAGWLEWVKETYPGARVLDYWQAPGDVQREFNAA